MHAMNIPMVYLWLFLSPVQLLFVCEMNVCLAFFIPLENFSLMCLETSPLPVKGCKFYCSALMAIKQWGFFWVPHLLWHGPTLYNSHLKDLWHSHLFKRALQWNCHYLFKWLKSVMPGDRSIFCKLGKRSTDWVTAAGKMNMKICPT